MRDSRIPNQFPQSRHIGRIAEQMGWNNGQNPFECLRELSGLIGLDGPLAGAMRDRLCGGSPNSMRKAARSQNRGYPGAGHTAVSGALRELRTREPNNR